MECDKNKVHKGYVACSRAYRQYDELEGGLTSYMRDTGLQYIAKQLESITSLPQGAMVIFSFWQGISSKALSYLGQLASACDTFKVLCFVENGHGGTPENKADWVHSELNFPKMTVHRTIPVTANGGNRFTTYILVKND